MFVNKNFRNSAVEFLTKVLKNKAVCRAMCCGCAIMIFVTMAYSPAMHLFVVSALEAAFITGVRFFFAGSLDEDDWKGIMDEPYS